MIELKKTIAQLGPHGTDVDKIDYDIDLIADLGYDSVSLMQLVVELERQFGIVVDDWEWDSSISQYAELEKLVRRKQSGGTENDNDLA
jgi:Acyl carrier protein